MSAKRWCFTLNNPTNDEIDGLIRWATTNPAYLIFGREVGDNGTPHLQGFFLLKRRRRLSQCKQLPGLSRAHFEIARGSTNQAISYCKKDGDFQEFGECPVVGQGKRSEFEQLKEWCKALTTMPSERDLADAFPSLYGRYPKACFKFVELFGPSPRLVESPVLRNWQRDLYQMLQAPADDRKIIFVVDDVGNTGKSWFIRFMLTQHPESCQRLSVGKRDDLAYAVDPSKHMFLFDIPRGQSEYIQYSVLEQLKDGLIFSSKYESRNKVMASKSHVVVMTNEQPDLNKLSMDRYAIINI